MGNCQAAEASTVVIHRPGSNRVERLYWSASAREVMNSNPGHYVALVVESPTKRSGDGAPAKQLKLLRPDDTLVVGQVYRLISFEDVMREFAAKKCVKLGKLLKMSNGGELSLEKKRPAGRQSSDPDPKPINRSLVKKEQSSGNSSNRGVGRHRGGGGGGQWKPALQSIAELGS